MTKFRDKKLLSKEKQMRNFKGLEHEIELVQDASHVYTRPYRRNQKENEVVSNEIVRMLEKGRLQNQ